MENLKKEEYSKLVPFSLISNVVWDPRSKN